MVTVSRMRMEFADIDGTRDIGSIPRRFRRFFRFLTTIRREFLKIPVWIFSRRFSTLFRRFLLFLAALDAKALIRLSSLALAAMISISRRSLRDRESRKERRISSFLNSLREERVSTRFGKVTEFLTAPLRDPTGQSNQSACLHPGATNYHGERRRSSGQTRPRNRPASSRRARLRRESSRVRRERSRLPKLAKWRRFFRLARDIDQNIEELERKKRIRLFFDTKAH